MTTGIIIFLAVSVVALVIVLAIITSRYIQTCRDYDAEFTKKQNKIAVLISEKETLILDKITLSEKNRELYNDNIRLADAVRELRVVNKALTEPKQETKILLPSGHTNMYRCEDYRLFDPKSDQYRLQQECITISNTGIRAYVSKQGYVYYCAALAGAYGIEIGHAYKVKLRCGTELNVIMGDFKHPIDNVSPYDYGDADVNYDGQPTTSVIEFIVDMDAVPEEVKKAGTMSALDEFGGLYGDGGDIVEMTDLGKVW